MRTAICLMCACACLAAVVIPAAGAISNMGWIQVISNVDGASVYFDNVYRGMTTDGQLVVTVYMAAPVAAYRVEKSGFTTASGTLEMPGAGATTKTYAILRPLSVPTPTATSGALSVDSAPQGARVYLNGYYRGLSPSVFDQLTPGTYTVAFVLDGYTSYSTLVRLSAGTTTNVTTTLAPLSPISLSVTSVPSGSSVSVDGQFRGTTPLTVGGVAPGDHRVEVSAPGYRTWNTTISLAAGSSRTLSAELVQAVTPSPTAIPTPTATPTRSTGGGVAAAVAATVICALVAWFLVRRR